MSLHLPPLAYPGLPLAPTSTHSAGPGTHIFNTHIIASLSGRPTLLPAADKTSKPTISVPRILPSPTHAAIPSSSISNTNTLPKVGDVVLARVQRVRVRQVEVGILCVGVPSGSDSGSDSAEGQGGEEEGGKEQQWAVNSDAYAAIIRREDIRATEKEKVVCSDGFRVGDIVRAVVVSLGDQANYYLTTAKNELGVLMAKSEVGNTMVPVSWREFRDPVSGAREGRKVAKPF